MSYIDKKLKKEREDLERQIRLESAMQKKTHEIQDLVLTNGSYLVCIAWPSGWYWNSNEPKDIVIGEY